MRQKKLNEVTYEKVSKNDTFFSEDSENEMDKNLTEKEREYKKMKKNYFESKIDYERKKIREKYL